MSVRGAGDRWLAGEVVPGVTFARHDVVRVVAGERTGTTGTIALLLSVLPEPTYLLTVQGGSGEVRARQSSLSRLEPVADGGSPAVGGSPVGGDGGVGGAPDAEPGDATDADGDAPRSDGAPDGAGTP